MHGLRRVPWIVWALIAPAVVIGVTQLVTGGGRRVPVVAAGPLDVVRAEDAPEGARLDLQTAARESLGETERRFDEEIGAWPDVIVVGFDARALEDDAAEQRARAALSVALESAKNATAVPVIASFVVPDGASAELRERVGRINEWWRRELCQRKGRYVCLDLQPHAGDTEAVRAAVTRAVQDALASHEAWRATTQRSSARGDPGPPHASTATTAGPSRTNGWWGMAVGLYEREAERRGLEFPPSLAGVASLGGNAVLLPVAWEQSGTGGTRIAPGPSTVDDGVVREMARRARRHGMRVALMPMVRLRGAEAHEWRGVIRPADEAAWWTSYERFVQHYAELAADAGVSLLAVGTELSSMSAPEHAAHWREVARVARSRFDGELAYVANHDALDRRAPFEAVDVVGVSAYFPLADDVDASPERLRRAWKSRASKLAGLARDADKPVVLFEVGYPSVDGGAVHPWDYTTGAPIDLEEQHAAYAAFASATRAAPWLRGAFFWIWFGPGGPHCRYYTPRDKPAEDVVRRYLAGQASGA